MIQKLHQDFDLSLMCDLLQVSRQGYYDFCHRTICPAECKRRMIVGAIRQAHLDSHGRYGSPNIHKDLLDKGIECCVNTVARLMKLNRIASTVRRKFRIRTTDSHHDQPIFENTLNRDFKAHRINQKWACDITYIDTQEGCLYLAGVLDLFSRKIVGWCIKDTLHTDLCVEALEMAVAARMPKPGLLHHSDRGTQYASRQYQRRLDNFLACCSMSRVGNCWDNAVVESLWAALKCELVHQRKFKTKEEARQAIFEWIVIWYNRKRRHSALGYLCPDAFEAQQN